MNCKDAYAQGYADLAHKMGCSLPHTGSDLRPLAVIAILLVAVGFAALLLERCLGRGE